MSISLKSESNTALTSGQSRNWGWLLPVAVFGAALGVYLATSASGLTWKNGGDDGGDLATAAKLLGIAHPTGYPLYLLLAQPLIWTGIEATRALTLLSALYGAIACALLTLAITRLLQMTLGYNLNEAIIHNYDQTGRKANRKTIAKKNVTLQLRAEICSRVGGASAGLLLAFAPLFWSQNVIAEVYALNGAFTALTLWSAVRWLDLKQRAGSDAKRGLGLLILATGLMAAHHRTGFLTIVALAVFLLVGLGGGHRVLAFAKTLRAKDWLVGVGLFLICFLPYLYILARGGQTAAANWLNPGWNNWGGFWDEINATFYHNYLFAAPASQSLERVSALAQMLLGNFGVWGLLAGLAGWWATATLPTLKPFFWFALVGFVIHAGFAIIYVADNGQVYLLPAFLLWAGVSGVGIAYLLWQLQLITQAQIGAGIGSVLVLGALQLFLHYGSVDASQDQTAQNWVSQTLNATPAHAVLLTDQDAYTFALNYTLNARGQRPDLIAVETRLLHFDWYRANLQRLYPELKLDSTFQGSDAASQLIQANPNLHFFKATATGVQAT